jgi:hypothetical protein
MNAKVGFGVLVSLLARYLFGLFLKHEDGGSTFLQNVSEFILDDMTSRVGR